MLTVSRSSATCESYVAMTDHVIDVSTMIEVLTSKTDAGALSEYVWAARRAMLPISSTLRSVACCASRCVVARSARHRRTDCYVWRVR